LVWLVIGLISSYTLHSPGNISPIQFTLKQQDN
jgi:hypothetical protein